MSDVVMHKARAIIHGQETVVVLPDAMPFAGEARYDAKIHKGHLKCMFCDAAVHFNKGSATIAGQFDLRGASPHFHTNRGQTHGDRCQWNFGDKHESGTAVDKKAGFRLHLNTQGYTGDFNAVANPLYRREADKRLTVTEEAARVMETRSIRGVADLVELMRLQDPLRINQSRVILNEYDVLWPDFMIRYNRSSKTPTNRFMDLVDRLSASYRKRQPVLMEFNVRSGVYPRTTGGKTPAVQSQDIRWRREASGVTQVIRPTAYLNNRHNTGVSLAFATAGRYLVLGMARLKTVDAHDAQLHFVDIGIDDPRQVTKISLEDIAAENSRHFPR